MADRAKAIWLGLFIILALVLAGWLILFLRPSVGDGGLILTVRFSNIDKISEGTRVTYAGRPIGEVYEIRELKNPRLAPANAAGHLYIYELLLKVDSHLKIYTYDEITFASSGLLGEKSIAIIPKAPPPGAPPATDVTHDVLYAQSTDKLEQTLNTLTDVALTFQDTLEIVSSFIETNNRDFHAALSSLNKASHELSLFMARANETDVAGKAAIAADKLVAAMTKADVFFSAAEKNSLVERMGTSFDALYEASAQIAYSEGTLGRLIKSDCLYVQLTTVLCQLKTVLYDIQTYGLLYQFDRKWQRSHDLRRCCTEISHEPYGKD